MELNFLASVLATVHAYELYTVTWKEHSPKKTSNLKGNSVCLYIVLTSKETLIFRSTT